MVQAAGNDRPSHGGGTRSILGRLFFAAAIGICGEISALGADLKGEKPPARAEQEIAAETATDPADDRRIAALIRQLGDPAFARRQRAQHELLRLGPAAFDAVHAAQQHADLEIALQARYLLNRFHIHWIEETDSPIVQRILGDYQRLSPEIRARRIDRLAILDGPIAIAALCRVVRFESVEARSKQAALALLKREPPEEGPARRQYSAALLEQIGSSQRPAAQWVRAFGQTLQESAEVWEYWDRLVQDDIRALAEFNGPSQRELTYQFVTWHIDLLRQHQRQEPAARAMERLLDVQDGSKPILRKTADWLLERQGWSPFGHLREKYAAEFADDVELQYRQVASLAKQGESAAAEQLAGQIVQRAGESPEQHFTLGLRLLRDKLWPWPEGELRRALEILDERNPALAEFRLNVKFWLAYICLHQGKADEAEKWYRQVIQSAQGGHDDDAYVDLQVRASMQLAELLHDHEKDLAAAEVLLPIARRMEQDDTFGKLVQNLGPNPASIQSRMHFFYAEHFRRADDRSKQVDHLTRGFEKDPADADVLIAMYRVAEKPPTWQTVPWIEQAASKFRAEIERMSNEMDGSPDSQKDLAREMNQFAWLIANTEGDYAYALECGRRMVSLVPDEAGFLDTLGRCYFAMGDYARAIKHQREAVTLEPYSQQIGRQLKMFEETQGARQP